MKIRTVLSLALVCVSVVSSLAEEKKPNVLFIVCDDLNTHVSTSGYPHITTPAFDHLAAEGMTFRRAYCQYPVCGPSRASFLSGLYPQSTGILSNQTDIREIRPGTVSMPQCFKESGYWTGAVGKVFHNTKTDPGEVAWNEMLRFENDEMPIVTPFRKKFEAEHGPITEARNRRRWKEFYPTIANQTKGQKPGWGPTGLRDEQHKDGKNARQIAAWLENKVYGDQPFFMACGIQKPHIPCIAPDKYFDMYPTAELKFTPASLEFWKQAPKIAQTKRYEGYDFEFGVENDSLRREHIQAYHACISFINAQIGVVFDALHKSGHWDDTIVILTSDHGYLLGEKFMWGKVMLFETCDRVPMVIRVPGQTEPGSTSEGLVELIDLFPTLAELCDVTPPDELQGRSIVPMLRESNHPGKEVAYTVVVRGSDLGKAIRTDQWRYTHWPDGSEELYDLKVDPTEEINLAKSAKHAVTVATMRQLLRYAESVATAKKRSQGKGANADWLEEETKRQIEGCKIKSDSGIWLHTPDGIGHYKALWTRDYYYFVKYAGQFIDDANLKASIQYVLDGQRDDGCIPDRVNADGKPIYSPGGDKKPLADHALDNAPFIALLACEYVRRTGDNDFFRDIEPKLRMGLDHVRRAENGLVYNPPDDPQCVYGFTDIVAKTGHLLFSSLLYYQACTELDEVQKAMGGDHATDYRARADLIRKHIAILWDDESGMYLAADKDCRQIDIWGSAYAAEVGLANDEQQDRIAEYILTHWDEIVLRGQVRHLPGKQGWQRIFGDRADRYPVGSYINGAHWATPLPWVVPVVAPQDPDRAKQMVNDVIDDFQANGVAECINGETRKVPNFVASITNLYAASRWLDDQH